MLKETVVNFSLSELKLAQLAKKLQTELRLLREDSLNRKYYAIFRTNELSGEIEILTHCGLQQDIQKRIGEGKLAFNSAWLKFISNEEITKIPIKINEGKLGRQLAAIFGSHPVTDCYVIIASCDDHEFIVFLEARLCEDLTFDLQSISDKDLELITARIYLAFLKSLRERQISDWEKAVHELSSPLDFIYSNSDFLVKYIDNPGIDIEQRKQKIEDFKWISNLLINRLHQFRFAFAGTATHSLKIEQQSLYKLCMPITHLMYHEAVRKSLKFKYDELRNITLRTDGEIVQFITFNLISNAIKYSYKGKTIILYANHSSKERVVFGVRNQGIPIENSDRYKIFNRGFRSEAGKKWDARGMGIGLSVCRQLTQLLGGSIRLLDNTGESTVFEVRIPDVPL